MMSLTCSGKLQAFGMPVLNFFTKILSPVLEVLLKMETLEASTSGRG